MNQIKDQIKSRTEILLIINLIFLLINTRFSLAINTLKILL